jgi:uncharacterized membrane protein
MGHPLHPAFVHFPVALWSVSLLWDGLWVATGAERWWHAGYWSLAAGSAMAVPALLTGFLEYVRLPREHPGERSVVAHGAVMSAAAAAFVASLLLRQPTPPPAWSPLQGTLSAAGFLLLLAGGWLAARLVYSHGVGQARG